MYQTRKTFIKSEMKVADLIFENPSLLVMMEHFNLDIVVQNKNVDQICTENNINPEVYVAIANLYNGFKASGLEGLGKADIEVIIEFLKNTHQYYLVEKIPELHGYIRKLYEENNNREIMLVERFFDEYSKEVKEHLEYEDAVAFPYFLSLVNNSKSIANTTRYSVGEYRDHHSDIETKLDDLKKLLLKHVSLKNNPPLRRKLIMGLLELEYNLNIHSLIEESILIPLIKTIEK